MTRKYTRRALAVDQPSDNGGSATVQDYDSLPVDVAEPDPAAESHPRVWKRIYEIDAGDMPFEHPLYPLFRELRLRLENTPPSMALVIVINDPAALEPTLLSLRELFKERLGKRWVELVTEITVDGEALLYVRRGPSWKSVSEHTDVF